MTAVSFFSQRLSLPNEREISFFWLGDGLIQRILSFVAKIDLAKVSRVDKKLHQIVKLIQFQEKIENSDLVSNQSWVDDELFLSAEVLLLDFSFPFICVQMNSRSPIKLYKDLNVLEYRVTISQKCHILDHQTKLVKAHDERENILTIPDCGNVQGLIANELNDAGFEVTFIGQRAFHLVDDDGNQVFKLHDLKTGTLLISDESIEIFHQDKLECFRYICYYKEQQLVIIDSITGSKSSLEIEEDVPSAHYGSHFVEFYKAETRVTNLETKISFTLAPCPENKRSYFSQDTLLYELESKKGLHLQLFNCSKAKGEQLHLDLPADCETKTLFLHKNAVHIVQENRGTKKTIFSQFHLLSGKTRQLFILDEIDSGISVIENAGRFLIKNGDWLRLFDVENGKRLFESKNVYFWEYLQEQRIVAIVSNLSEGTVNIVGVDIAQSKALFTLLKFPVKEVDGILRMPNHFAFFGDTLHVLHNEHLLVTYDINHKKNEA